MRKVVVPQTIKKTQGIGAINLTKCKEVRRWKGPKAQPQQQKLDLRILLLTKEIFIDSLIPTRELKLTKKAQAIGHGCGLARPIPTGT